MPPPDARLHCPHCRATMTRGTVAVSQGLTWRRADQSGHADFTEQLPGTQALRRSNRLPAWRCPACELVLIQYGKAGQRLAQQQDADALTDHLAFEQLNPDPAKPDAER
ncbi:MAG: PF20097 family protein [Planctomycetota bacterium]